MNTISALGKTTSRKEELAIEIDSIATGIITKARNSLKSRCQRCNGVIKIVLKVYFFIDVLGYVSLKF